MAKYPPTYIRSNLRAIVILATGCAAAFALADLSFGDQCATGTCRNVVHKAAVVHHQQAYVAPVVSQNVYYFVGAPVRAEALIEEAKLADPDYQEFLQFKEWRARIHDQQPADDLPPAEPSPEEPPRFSSTDSVINTSCISCHSGETPKGNLDVTKPLDEGAKWRMFMRAAQGDMPPAKPLDNEQLRELLIELSET